jgi:signal transduction histidine kinase
VTVTDASRLGRLELIQQRLDGVIRYVPYVALAVATAIQVAGGGWPAGPATLVLAVVIGGWMLWMTILHPQWEQRRPVMVVFILVQLALSTALVALNPLFGFFAWTNYLYVIYALRGRWRLAGTAWVGVLTATSQVGGWESIGAGLGLLVYALVVVLNVGIGSAMVLLSSTTIEQSERRRTMIVELAEANDQLAAALAENAGLHQQLLAQAREAGVLDERQRMAAEIHDILAQGLTGIVTQLEAADQAAARPAEWRRHVNTAKTLARASLTEARRSVQALSPQPLAAAALPEALAEVVDEWSGRHGVVAELITTGAAQRLLPEIETTLLRTAQEALANVARHAAASRVALTLSYMEDLVTLDVRDDGAGFDPAAPAASSADGGYGLAAMRERIRRIAGTLAVESEPGGGTAISACVPAVGVGASA